MDDKIQTPQTFTQPELFQVDPERPGALSVNPEALASDALAKRAFNQMPEAAIRDQIAAESERLEAMRFEHDDNNPYKNPDLGDLARITAAFQPPKKVTISEAKANARRHEARARRQRR